MDDSNSKNQIVNSKNDQGSAQQTTATPVQTPVSGGKKEAFTAPVSQEWVAPSIPEVVLPQEVKDVGVETKSEFPKLTQEQKAAGLQEAKEATTIKPVEPTSLNMQTSHPVLQTLKATHKKIQDSLTWLIRMIIKEQDKKNKNPDYMKP